MTLVHTEERGGFEIRLYAEPEELSPRGEFMNEDGSDDEDTLERIESGFYAWFCAKVTASKAGVDLATDYLGACCYKSVNDFIVEDGYYGDMVLAVIAEAHNKLAELADKAE